MKAPRWPVRTPRQHYPDRETQNEWWEWLLSRLLISPSKKKYQISLTLNTDSPINLKDNYTI